MDARILQWVRNPYFQMTEVILILAQEPDPFIPIREGRQIQLVDLKRFILTPPVIIIWLMATRLFIPTQPGETILRMETGRFTTIYQEVKTRVPELVRCIG